MAKEPEERGEGASDDLMEMVDSIPGDYRRLDSDGVMRLYDGVTKKELPQPGVVLRSTSTTKQKASILRRIAARSKKK